MNNFMEKQRNDKLINECVRQADEALSFMRAIDHAAGMARAPVSLKERQNINNEYKEVGNKASAYINESILKQIII